MGVSRKKEEKGGKRGRLAEIDWVIPAATDGQTRMGQATPGQKACGHPSVPFSKQHFTAAVTACLFVYHRPKYISTRERVASSTPNGPMRRLRLTAVICGFFLSSANLVQGQPNPQPGKSSATNSRPVNLRRYFFELKIEIFEFPGDFFLYFFFLIN